MKKLFSLLLSAVMLAGILSLAVISAFALPSPAPGRPFDAAVSVDGDQMDIAGKSMNNVTTWTSFDVQEDEVIQFADNNNYMIIVDSEGPTQINGTLQGGGKVYIVNPNGVIFGRNSDVNVGNLYVAASPFMQGSVLSAGYPWIVVTVAVAAVFGLGGFLLGRRKRPADGITSEDEE